MGPLFGLFQAVKLIGLWRMYRPEPRYGSKEWCHKMAREVCRQHGVLDKFEAAERAGEITPVEMAIALQVLQKGGVQ